MKKILIAIIISATSITAYAKHSNNHQYDNSYNQVDESQLDNADSYVNKFGKQVHSPAHSKHGTPHAASAKCRDGTYSFSKHHSGTCSRHKGVDEWL